MCWSARVSFWFGCLDLAFVSLLLLAKRMHLHHRHVPLKHENHNQSSFAGTYATILLAVTAQEWTQFGMWKRIDDGINPSQLCSTATDVALSLAAALFAECIPLIVILSSWLSDYQDNKLYHSYNKPLIPKTSAEQEEALVYRQGNRMIALAWWLSQFITIVASGLYSHSFCSLQVGPNHHLVWFMEVAVYAMGGYTLKSIAFFQYILSSLFSIESMDMAMGQKLSFQAIVLVSSLASFALYSATLEASSIWCWSAFILGFYFCGQELWALV